MFGTLTMGVVLKMGFKKTCKKNMAQHELKENTRLEIKMSQKSGGGGPYFTQKISPQNPGVSMGSKMQWENPKQLKGAWCL